MKSWGLSEKNNNSRILVAFYTSEVSKCNLVLRMSNVQSSKNVGGGFFYTTSAGNFLTFTNIFKQCFRARFLNISIFSFSTVSIFHRGNVFFFLLCLSQSQPHCNHFHLHLHEIDFDVFLRFSHLLMPFDLHLSLRF